MQLGILGTGNVAQTLARRWSAAGHEITFGSRDPAARSALDAPVTSLAEGWQDAQAKVEEHDSPRWNSNRPEDRAMRDASRRRPGVHGGLHPRWDRDGSHMSTLADQIGNHPVLLPLLNPLEAQGQQLGAAESTTNQHRDHRVVAQLTGSRRSCTIE